MFVYRWQNGRIVQDADLVYKYYLCFTELNLNDMLRKLTSQLKQSLLFVETKAKFIFRVVLIFFIGIVLVAFSISKENDAPYRWRFQ